MTSKMVREDEWGRRNKYGRDDIQDAMRRERRRRMRMNINRSRGEEETRLRVEKRRN